MRPTHDQRSTCDEALEWLALELGNDATAEERERLRLHLEQCEGCRGEAVALGESHRALVEHAPAPPTEAALTSLRAAVAKSVAEEPKQHRQGPGPSTVRWLALAAALLLAVTLAMYWSRPPEPLAEGPAEAHRDAPAPTPANEPGDPRGSAPPELTPLETVPPNRVAEDRRPEPVEEPIRSPAPESVTPRPTPVPGPRAIAPPQVATASLAAEAPRTATPFTLKLVSDEPDLVIYWLVDPADTHTLQENPDATAL